jgi:hypothetical protein
MMRKCQSQEVADFRSLPGDTVGKSFPNWKRSGSCSEDVAVELKLSISVVVMKDDISSVDADVVSFTKRRKGGVSEISVSIDIVFLLCDLRRPRLGFWIV